MPEQLLVDYRQVYGDQIGEPIHKAHHPRTIDIAWNDGQSPVIDLLY
ncbi:hypothetical protein [Brevibacillus reuszeri]|nr:hypothetical protein [Brevibacillus reuszeri]